MARDKEDERIIPASVKVKEIFSVTHSLSSKFMIRVLVFSHTYLPAHYRGKLRWLANTGKVQITLAALEKLRLPTGVSLAFEHSSEPFAYTFVKPILFHNHNVLRLYNPQQIANLLYQLHPDIVHVEAEPHSVLLGLLALFKQFFSYRLVAFSWENLFRRGRGPLKWLEGLSLKRVDWMIVGNSEAEKAIRWRGYYGPVSVIPQVGLDPEHFEECIYEPQTSLFRIGFVGRLVREKGVLDLWEAFVPLAGQASLVLIGEGPLRDVICRRAQALSIDRYVEIIGYIPYAQMPTLLKRLSVLVLPSRTTPFWKEQFGHVLAEAMLAGVPVVGSDSGAIPEVIGEAGLIFPEGNVEMLRKHLLSLMRNQDECRRLADLGRNRALNRFTDAAIGSATLQVYQQVLKNS